MTTSKGALWGITAVLMALLILSATTAAVYYGKYQTEASQNRAYAGELDAALESYRSLQVSYNASLADYNQTISLLAAAVADLNTSTPAYREAGVALATLWSEYRELASSSGQGPLAYEVRMLVDYGNGTRGWYNDTAAQPGWNGYVVTLVSWEAMCRASGTPSTGSTMSRDWEGSTRQAPPRGSYGNTSAAAGPGPRRGLTRFRFETGPSWPGPSAPTTSTSIQGANPNPW